MQQTSQILDVAIGLTSLYLLLSLICSALVESLEKWWSQRRPRHLSEGLQELFGGGADGLKFLENFYNSPLIFGLFKGNAKLENNRLISDAKSANLPSYIDSKLFSGALLQQILDGKALNITTLQAQIAANPELPEQLKTSLQTLIATAGNDTHQAIANIEGWYTAMTDRVSGWYKRHTQLVAFCMAAALTLAGNFDSIAIGKSLMLNESLRNKVVENALALNTQNPSSNPQQCSNPQSQSCKDWLNSQITTLQNLGMPVGWENASCPETFIGVAEKLLGWLMTIIAVSLGAPFWFDLLNKFVNIRSTLKPAASGTAKTETQKPTAAG